MQASRNPAKSRPLSANVKRLMRLARASPKNDSIIVLQREFTAREYAYCHKQGNLFMEAASMGIGMEEFAPLFMTSQLAGVFDVSFAAACGIENDELSNLLRIPILLKSPETIVKTKACFFHRHITRKRSGFRQLCRNCPRSRTGISTS